MPKIQVEDSTGRGHGFWTVCWLAVVWGKGGLGSVAGLMCSVVRSARLPVGLLPVRPGPGENRQYPPAEGCAEGV